MILVDLNVIKTELEKRLENIKKEHELPNGLITSVGQGVVSGYRSILDYLESLQPSVDVNLEKEIVRYTRDQYHENFKNFCSHQHW